MSECQRIWDNVILSNHGREAEFWLEYANVLRSVGFWLILKAGFRWRRSCSRSRTRKSASDLVKIEKS